MARVKVICGKKSAPKPVDAVNSALRGGIGVARYRISKAQGEEIRRA